MSLAYKLILAKTSFIKQIDIFHKNIRKEMNMATHESKQIYTQKWEVGAHTGFGGSIYESLVESIGYGMYATQIFLGNPKSFNRHKASSQDVAKALQLVDRFPIHVFSHFPYIANLAGSVKSLAWHGDDIQDAKTTKVLEGLQYELGVLANFTVRRNGVVIHPGAYPDRKKGLKNIAKSINRIDFPPNSKLLLENAAGQGNALATTFKEIARIIKYVDEEKKPFIGVCVDTAHIWGVGDYDLRKISEVDRMFEEFDKHIGLERFTLLHLNDSKVELGSRKDRHECLGAGYIWSDSFDSLIHLMNKCKTHGIPAVLETHGMDMITLAALGEL
jgi:deoxyribonuclease-4